MTQEFLMQMLGPAAAAVGAYVGVRVELAAMRVRLERVEYEMKRAHQRLDALK